jgi:F1F0 ATPase subunit 2
MTQTISLIWSASAGLLIGGMFFGGLWWTVRKALTAKHPALWFLVSLLLRVIITMIGFYLVADGQAKRLAACLGGFIIARLIVTQVTGPPLEPDSTSQPKETGHACQSR